MSRFIIKYRVSQWDGKSLRRIHALQAAVIGARTPQAAWSALVARESKDGRLAWSAQEISQTWNAEPSEHYE